MPRTSGSSSPGSRAPCSGAAPPPRGGLSRRSSPSPGRQAGSGPRAKPSCPASGGTTPALPPRVPRGRTAGPPNPAVSERREVPHHLIDVADPDEEYNAGRFVAEAEEAIRGIRGRGRFPLVAGGTGMYIRSLLRGLDALPSDAGIRAGLAGGWGAAGGPGV